jgi:hypothetical protein
MRLVKARGGDLAAYSVGQGSPGLVIMLILAHAAARPQDDGTDEPRGENPHHSKAQMISMLGQKTH